MDIQAIADLAKQGSRLDSTQQWVLADALAGLSETQISTVAVTAGRNESTLLQYARAAQRWPQLDRVQGVSFSAHRVALSWHDPRSLLVDLKAQFGSPTVQQVRQAMGLEGHPAIELLEKGIKKLDHTVSQQALAKVSAQLLEFYQELTDGYGEDEPEDEPVEQEETILVLDDTDTEEPLKNEPARKGTWQPPVRTSDIAGI